MREVEVEDPESAEHESGEVERVEIVERVEGVERFMLSLKKSDEDRRANKARSYRKDQNCF